MRRASWTDRWLVGGLAALMAFCAACGGGGHDGGLCASCDDEHACNESDELASSDQISFFCGDASPQNCNICTFDVSANRFVCSVKLKCVHQKDSNRARRCYPLTADGKTHPDFECDGSKPRPGE